MRRQWVVIGLGGYVLLALAVLLLPVSYSEIVNGIGQWFRAMGLSFFGYGWIEFGANILMFVPLGFLLALLLPRQWYAVVLAFVLSVGAEIAQVFIASRQPSLRDILANTLGAAIGVAVAWLIVRRRTRAAAATDALQTASTSGAGYTSRTPHRHRD